MFKEINIEDFYIEKNENLGAVTIITPKQRVTTLNLPYLKENFLTYGIGGHQQTIDLLTCKILGREEKSNNANEELKRFDEIDEILQNNFPDGVVHKKFITIFHITDRSLINLPNIITPYEYNELQKISEILKEHNVITECSICENYDILDDREIADKTYKYIYSENALEDALNYFKDNNKIKDYNLFDEIIINKNKKKK